MGRAFLTISFMVVLLGWLRWEFHRKVSLKRHWKWFASALLVQAVAGLLFLVIDDRIVGNFFYHAIGGGVTSTLLYIYLLKTYGISYSWRVELVLLYCFVVGMCIR